MSDVEERKLVTAASWQDLRDVGAPLLPIERDDIAGGVVGRFVGCERYRSGVVLCLSRRKTREVNKLFRSLKE